jgi:hypothetical protein
MMMIALTIGIRCIPMRRFALKALVAVLTLNRAKKRHIDWNRIVLLASTCVTIGLVMLYGFGKATSRW